MLCFSDDIRHWIRLTNRGLKYIKIVYLKLLADKCDYIARYIINLMFQLSYICFQYKSFRKSMIKDQTFNYK